MVDQRIIQGSCSCPTSLISSLPLLFQGKFEGILGLGRPPAEESPIETSNGAELTNLQVPSFLERAQVQRSLGRPVDPTHRRVNRLGGPGPGTRDWDPDIEGPFGD